MSVQISSCTFELYIRFLKIFDFEMLFTKWKKKPRQAIQSKNLFLECKFVTRNNKLFSIIENV